MNEWTQYHFEKTLIKNLVSRSNQIPKSEIKETGKYPVIDQGKSFIAGYSDQFNKLIVTDITYIIFGDHTRCFKYVDFPFIVGADGTKVLSPNTKLFDPKFYYFFLLNLHIPNKGYNRHFKLLKEKIILQPPLLEQRKIAYVLSTIQKAIEKQQQIIETTTELKKALMQKLFTEGLHREKQKQTEIGLVPESWDEYRTSDFGKIITGSTPSTKISAYYGGKYNLISPANLIDDKYVNSSHRKLSAKGIIKARRLPINTVLVGCIGNVGKVGMTNDDDSATNQQINSIICNEYFNPHFIYYLISFYRNYIASKAAKVTVPILNKNNFENLIFYVPQKIEQNFITDYFSIIDDKINLTENRKTKLEELFKSMLNQLMTGQTRVNEVEFEKIKEEIM